MRRNRVAFSRPPSPVSLLAAIGTPCAPYANTRNHGVIEHLPILADTEKPDLGVDHYNVVHSCDGQTANAKESLRHHLQELGYAKPTVMQPLDSRVMRAVVHYEYSACLLRQVHREYEAIRHAEIVTELLPNFGEALLNCSHAYLRVGNSIRALDFAQRAQRAGPHATDSTMFEYLVARESYLCNVDIGDVGGERGGG